MWQAYTLCNLPAPLKGFVHQALRTELPIGERLASWKPLEVSCSTAVDGQIETMQHALFQCKFVDTAFRYTSTCFQDWTEGLHGIKLLLDTKTAESLLTPIGVLVWTALCASKASPEARLTDDYFFPRLERHIISVFKFKSLCDSTFRQCFKSHCIAHP